MVSISLSKELKRVASRFDDTLTKLRLFEPLDELTLKGLGLSRHPEQRWVPIGWQYNALKTSRYRHPSAWRDQEVRVLQYIVDKPWESRVDEVGEAGYLGRDGETHRCWWKEYDEWERFIIQVVGGQAVLDLTRRHVAPPMAAPRTNGHPRC